MALKYELEQWGAAVQAYDSQDFDKALDTFETIAESAKFHFNMGLIYATLGEHEEACRSYKKAVKLDQFFAVAYFQKGVSHFLLGEFEKALANFNDSLLYLRKNVLIDYEQLGLKFRLYSCEILFNRGLCYLYLGQTDQGMGDFTSAAKEKQTEEHEVIDEAITVQGQGFTVFSIPVGVIYRPPEGKLKNVKTKDYLGKAKLVAAVDPEDAFTGFTGAQQQKKQGLNTTTPITKANTEGAVIQINNGTNSRPTSPTEKPQRPKSLSSSPRNPPFPMRASRNPSIARRRPPQNEGTPIYVDDDKTSNGGGQFPDRRLPASEVLHKCLLKMGSLQQSRSNTLDSSRGSPKLPSNGPSRMSSVRDSNRGPLRDGPMRSNSLRESSRSNSIRNGPPRMNSIRGGRSTARAMPQRSNTQGRTQFLQQQMSKMSVSDDDQGYNDYYQDVDQYANNNITSPPPSNEDYQVNRPTSRSPSLRGRGGRGSFKPSPLSMQGGLLASPTADKETQFEMLPPPQKNSLPQSPYPSSPVNEILKEPTKIKIKCYHKDTRVVLVSASIIYSELIKRIQEKFTIEASLQLKYKDEDGSMVTMIDQEDFEMAISMIPRTSSDIGRMEIWIETE
ncbi:2005_t:CDS:10 [Funneliformis mosseae]|uniref:2005_t:CDS:1 n=1 Tax=Funneliformis mosseae TaxID=27381 RepID=A0A9N8VH26_FUNMO|nr:2005_t:CDS:10 [Funneliformis mosseae]